MSDLTTNENCKRCYQGVQLKHFERANVQEKHLSSVANICTNVKERLNYIKNLAIFKNIESILDTSTCPDNRDCSVLGTDAIKNVCEHFKELLVMNDFNIT